MRSSEEMDTAHVLGRCVRGKRRTLATAAMAAIATALLASGSLAAWHVYAGWQIGWIELTNGGPPIMAQVLPEIGEEPLGEPFPVIKSSTLAFPAGDYRLRVNAVGRLGRTYRFAVNRGETQTYALSLDEGRLLGGEPIQQFGGQPGPRDEPIPFALVTTALELTPGKADLIEWTGRSVIRRDGQTGTPIWDSERPPVPWRADENGADRVLRWMMEYGPPLELVKSAPDLDGDGVGDLVWFSRQATSLLATGLRGGLFRPSRDEPVATSGMPRLIRLSLSRRTRPGTGRQRSCPATAHRRSPTLTVSDGSDSTLQPANRGERRLIWGSSRFGRSSMRNLRA